MDEDLASMSPEELIEEVRKLRRGIRIHRDSTGHELCLRLHCIGPVTCQSRVSLWTPTASAAYSGSMLFELIAVLCAGLFAGAAIYISLVEHPLAALTA